MPHNAEPFIAARDLLLRLHADYDAAVREFRWPVMDRFNWALDFFDHLPADDLALWCVGETEEKLSFTGSGNPGARKVDPDPAAR